MRALPIILLTALFLVACSQEPAEPARVADQAVPADTLDPVLAALANPARPAADLATDLRRKPGEVLSFFGIKPGMKCWICIPAAVISRNCCRT